MKLKELRIGDLVAKRPVIQGGMGVGVSLSKLAGAVAREGGIGVISAAQPGFKEPDFATDTMGANLRALKRYIKEAKELAQGGIVGVNIMCAMNHYEDFVRCTVESGADLIISGAGLPVDLPKYVEGSNVKIAPIVSPPKAAKVLLKMWDKHYHRTADFIVIEGPKAGGHLGYSPEEVEEYDAVGYDERIKEIIDIVREYEEKYQQKIPVIFGGGVFDRNDIDHYMELGCDGVQMATRFVTTYECDVDDNFKKAYLEAKKEDVAIVKSPVGMPGRALRNDFIKAREKEREHITKCYGCLKKCDMNKIPYCITTALCRAANGDTDNALIFCGENVWRLDRMMSVKELMEELCD